MLKNNYSISVSIDGPEYINNKTRKCYTDKNFFSVVENNLLKAKQLGISTGICAVISKQNISSVKNIFEYFERLGINYNIIPINICGSAKDNYANLSITPEEYGKA